MTAVGSVLAAQGFARGIAWLCLLGGLLLGAGIAWACVVYRRRGLGASLSRKALSMLPGAVELLATGIGALIGPGIALLGPVAAIAWAIRKRKPP